MRLTILALILAALMSAQTPSETAARLFADYYEDLLRANPELATRVGRGELNDRWSDLSREARRAWRETQRRYVERLEALPAERLDAGDRVSRELLLGQLRQSLEGAAVEDYLLAQNQLFGLHTNVFLTIDAAPARSVRDYENLVARLEALPAYVDQAVELLNEGIAEGLVQPAYIARIIAEQVEAQAKPPADESPLLKPFREFPDGVPAAEGERLRERARRAYRESFQPAWRKLGAFIAERAVEHGRGDIAALSLPNGAAVYAHLVRRYTTTDLQPEQIHQLGLREVARIEAGMEAIAQEAGFADAAAYEKHLDEAPEQRFSSKEEMLVYCRNLAKIVDPELPRFFKKLPRAPFGIRAIPEDREAASASNYSRPAADGSRAGYFNLKAYKPEEQVRYDKPALVLHETNPGHHLQIALQTEMEDLPEFRKIYSATAYIEGWALYAESFGEELGVYDDPASRFGKLHSERFRARRLVVDTGLHVKGWSRERAIEYLGSESEVDRYIAWPGQALAYKIGQLKILELREKARAALGEKFDIRDFHDVVLRNGPLPLDLLETQVDQWLDKAP